MEGDGLEHERDHARERREIDAKHRRESRQPREQVPPEIPVDEVVILCPNCEDDVRLFHVHEGYYRCNCCGYKEYR